MPFLTIADKLKFHGSANECVAFSIAYVQHESESISPNIVCPVRVHAPILRVRPANAFCSMSDTIVDQFEFDVEGAIHAIFEDLSFGVQPLPRDGVEPCSPLSGIPVGKLMNEVVELGSCHESELSDVIQDFVLTQEQFEELNKFCEVFLPEDAPDCMERSVDAVGQLADTCCMFRELDEQLLVLLSRIQAIGASEEEYDRSSVSLQENIDKHNQKISMMLEVACETFGVRGIVYLISGLRRCTYVRLSPNITGKASAGNVGKKKRVRTKRTKMLDPTSSAAKTFSLEK